MFHGMAIHCADARGGRNTTLVRTGHAGFIRKPPPKRKPQALKNRRPEKIAEVQVQRRLDRQGNRSGVERLGVLARKLPFRLGAQWRAADRPIFLRMAAFATSVRGQSASVRDFLVPLVQPLDRELPNQRVPTANPLIKSGTSMKRRIVEAPPCVSNPKVACWLGC